MDEIKITFYDSEYCRVEVSELLTAMDKKGCSLRRLCVFVGWSRGYFSRLKGKKYAEIHKKDAEKLDILLNTP